MTHSKMPDATRQRRARATAALREANRTTWRAASWLLLTIQLIAIGCLLAAGLTGSRGALIAAALCSTIAFGGIVMHAQWDRHVLGDALAQSWDRVARQAGLIQSTSRSIIFMNAAGQITSVNEAFIAETGYSLDEVIGTRPVDRLISEHAEPDVVTAIEQAMAEVRPIRTEITRRNKFGRESTVNFEVLPMYHRDGTHAGFLSLSIDISAHVEVRERLSRIFNTVSEGVVMIDQTGAIMECNAAAERIVGLSPSEMHGRHLAEPVWVSVRRDGSPLPVEDTPAMVTLRSGVPVRDFVHGIRLPDGTQRLLSVSTEPLRDAAGAVVGVVMSFGDVTDILEKEQRMQLVVHSAALGTWDWHVPSGAVIYNARSAEMLGYVLTDYEPNVSMWERLLHPDDKAQVTAVLTAHLEGRTPEYRCEHRQQRKDGTWAWVLGAGQVVERGPGGEPLRAVGINMDISVQKAFEIDLLEARREADATNAQLIDANRTLEAATARAQEMAAQAAMASHAKSEFLANMSHEIRTPLTAILGYTDMLAEHLEAEGNESPASTAIETIQRAGQHLLVVINDVLDLSKIEAGRLCIERVEAPLPALLLDVDSLMRSRASQKGVLLRTSLASSVPDRIISDPTRFRQILMNLVGNAAKFTEQGSIDVRASILPAEDGRGDRLRIEVDDTGPGMTPEQARNLFQPFTQADASVTRRHGGTGLGLTICRRLAALMNGTVTLEYTAPGRGSRFVLELPVQAAPGALLVHSLDICTTETSVTGTATAAGAVALRGRILLAEDGEDNRRLIVHHLSRSGANVTTAANGRIALDLLVEASSAGTPFDLLVTDMQMPEMDGYTLARRLRASGDTIPIVALTAHAMAEDRQRCLDAGCNAYASKPIQRDRLLRTCAELLTASAPAMSGASETIVAPAVPPAGQGIDDVPNPRATPPMLTAIPEDAVLISDLADDPDMCGLVGPFLERLGDQVRAFDALRDVTQRTALASLAHQLKGAAGGYGYAPITQAAREVERYASAGGTQRECEDALNALLALCRAAIRGGVPGADVTGSTGPAAVMGRPA